MLAYNIMEYASPEREARECVREPEEDNWDPTLGFFEERRTDLGGARVR
jgi:hypothetical protein